ncbi:hypothetical protein HPB50_010955 [Hyalomma asiaticum]|uniref:Uncharacterized protein n=1 Tax=Hyalomma asiaticum TaxID=266040 RepID=A0ACB7TGB0_HYAAI|nr:hypothetical protein HPB50_010955 [Hyalomma asiaticum]
MCTPSTETFPYALNNPWHTPSYNTEADLDRNETAIESQPSALTADWPFKERTDLSLCMDEPYGSHALQNYMKTPLLTEQPTGIVPSHTRENDEQRLTFALHVVSAKDTREADAILTTAFSERASPESGGSSLKFTEPRVLPLKADDFDPGQEACEVLASMSRSSSQRKWPHHQILHRTARRLNESTDCARPHASGCAHNRRNDGIRMRVEDHPSTLRTGCPPTQPAASSNGKYTTRSFLCPYCGEVFYHKSTFGCHIAKHTSAKPYSCTVCARTFPHQNSLNGHYRIHASESLENRQNRCTGKDKAARATDSSTSVLDSHLDNSGEGGDTELHQARPLPAEGATDKSDAEHVLTAVKQENSFNSNLPEKPKQETKRQEASPHGIVKVKEEADAAPEEKARPRFSCPLCPRDFAQRGSQRDHVKRHFDRKSYHCHLCPQAFYYLSNLRRHVKRHSGEKEFQCEHCSNKFTRGGSLRYHLKNTHGLRPPEVTGSANSVP